MKKLNKKKVQIILLKIKTTALMILVINKMKLPKIIG